MDTVSESLHKYLTRMGKLRALHDKRMEDYISRLLLLLPPGHESVLCDYYGILGHKQTALEELALRLNTTEDQLRRQIEQDLRQIAITPEWQMINPLKQQ